MIDDKFPLAPMGVLAPGSAHARPSARPAIVTLWTVISNRKWIKLDFLLYDLSTCMSTYV